MARYIDANAVQMKIIKAMREKKDWQVGLCIADDIINEQPTADVVKVKRGKWIESYNNNCWHYNCPFCNDGYTTINKDISQHNYCSNCGADMRGGTE